MENREWMYTGFACRTTEWVQKSMAFLEEMVGYFGAIQIPGAVIPPIPPSLLQQLEAAQAGGGPVMYFGTPVSTFKVIDFFSFCDHLTVTNGFPTSLCSHSQRVRT